MMFAVCGRCYTARRIAEKLELGGSGQSTVRGNYSMTISDILSNEAVLKLPPTIFGRIRWKKSLGAPIGDHSTGFRVFVEEHTVSKFRQSAGGAERVPGTGIWKPAISVPCWTAPDESDRHVVAFNIRDVHFNEFPDGKYRVTV